MTQSAQQGSERKLCAKIATNNNNNIGTQYIFDLNFILNNNINIYLNLMQSMLISHIYCGGFEITYIMYTINIVCCLFVLLLLFDNPTMG